ALLVARVGADDADDALALDDLALRADGFDAGADFHELVSMPSSAQGMIDAGADFHGVGFRRIPRSRGWSGLTGCGGRAGEDPGALIEDRDRVLEVRGHRAISGYCRPVVIQLLYVRGPGVYHGFDGDDKAGFHAFAIVWLAEIGDLRILVHLPAGAVADVLPDNRKTA